MTWTTEEMVTFLPEVDAGSVEKLDPRIRTEACVRYKKDVFLVVTALPEYSRMTRNTPRFFTLSTGRRHILHFWPETLTHQR